MYCEAFKLREKPFSLAADPRYLYMSRQHWEAMAHLMYGVDDDWGFVLITGEIGTGKTTLCRLLLDQMPSDVEYAFLMNPRLTVQELLVSICDEFGIEPPFAASGIKELFDRISAHLLDLHARARKALLIVDEAQYLSPEVIDQLRLLTNLETEGGKLLRIILVGQPELRDKLAQPELEQMSQRITARYHLGPLSRKEVTAYVSHRMALSGAEKQFFTRFAMRALFRLSRGVPRLINVICDRALLGACMKKEAVVTRSTLIRAADEVLGWAGAGNCSEKAVRLRWTAAGLSAGMLGVLAFLVSNNVLSLKAVPVMQVSSRTGITSPAALPGVPGEAWWPAGLGLERSRDAAYKGLLDKKGLSYESSSLLTEDTFCSVIELFNYHCMDYEETARDLRNLPVPSILKLADDRGEGLFVMLQAVRGEKAVLRIGDAEKEVVISDVRSRWTGQYTTLDRSGSAEAAQRKSSPLGTGRRKG